MPESQESQSKVQWAQAISKRCQTNHRIVGFATSSDRPLERYYAAPHFFSLCLFDVCSAFFVHASKQNVDRVSIVEASTE
jgi:hypothetical protein